MSLGEVTSRNEPPIVGVDLPTGVHQPLSASWHLASGAISGVTSVLGLQPLDRAFFPSLAHPESSADIRSDGVG